VLLRDEFWEVIRTVYMDGRTHPPADQRFQQGHSTGRWEGDMLVVETTNFTDNAWGTARGIPSGAQKHVVELYQLTDSGATLTIDFTLADPEYLTAPIAGSEKWRYVPNRLGARVVRRLDGTGLLASRDDGVSSCDWLRAAPRSDQATGDGRVQGRVTRPSTWCGVVVHRRKRSARAGSGTLRHFGG
jgi:hypothetical protein